MKSIKDMLLKNTMGIIYDRNDKNSAKTNEPTISYLSQYSNGILNCVENINNLAGKKDVITKSVKPLSMKTGDVYLNYPLAQMIREKSVDDSFNAELAEEVQLLTTYAYNLSGKVAYLIKQDQLEQTYELDRNKSQFWQEWRQKWITWFTGSVKWLLGVVGAIGLYSLAVYLQQDYTWLKIPIHEFFK